MLTLSAHESPVRALAFSPDGRILISGGTDRTLRIWDLGLRSLRYTGRSHLHYVTGVAASSDNRHAASIGIDKQILMWDLVTGMSQAPYPRQGNILNALAFAPGGQCLATAAGLITCVAWSPDGTTVAAGSGHPVDYNRGAVRLWGIENPMEQAYLELTDMGRWTAHYADEAMTHDLGGRVRVVALWEPGKRQSRPHLEHRHAITTLAFAPDGTSLAVASGDTISLWNPGTGERQRILRGHAREIMSLSWAPDGRSLLSGGADRTIRLWEVDSGRTMSVYQWFSGKTFAVAISPDGLTAVAGGESQEIVLWDLDEGR